MSDPVLRIHRGVYVAQWTEDGKRVRRSLGTADKAEAERRLEHIGLTNRIIDRTRQKTVGELFEVYALHLRHQGKPEKYWRRIWSYIAPSFATTYPQYVTPEKCIKHCETRGVTDGTLRLELGLLRTVLSHAYKRKLIPDAIFIQLPPKPAPKTESLSKTDFRRLLDATEHTHLKLFLILGITTGARANAILSLTWNRVDLQRRTIDLREDRSITNKGRAVVPVNDTALRYLTEAYPLRTTNFVIEYRGSKINYPGHSIKRIGKRIGLKVTPHMLRHSAAVWMAEGGVPMSEIAQYLGHSNTAITERVYARYSPGYLQKAASHLEVE